jgi:hypothetical protein
VIRSGLSYQVLQTCSFAKLAINGPDDTPFLFHQISGAVMEIYSAGPDRKMWPADDLMIK